MSSLSLLLQRIRTLALCIYLLLFARLCSITFNEVTGLSLESYVIGCFVYTVIVSIGLLLPLYTLIFISMTLYRGGNGYIIPLTLILLVVVSLVAIFNERSLINFSNMNFQATLFLIVITSFFVVTPCILFWLRKQKIITFT